MYAKKNSSFFIRFLAPEYLFLLGVAQALFPYIIWAVRGVNENYDQEIFGTPILLWSIGFLSFYVGAKFSSVQYSKNNLGFMIDRRRVQFVTYLSLMVWILLLFPVIHAYGGIPILEFLSGSTTIDNINESQSTTIPGLFGIWLVSNTVLAISATLAVIARHSCKRTLSVLILVLGLAVIFGSIMAGKRQSLLIAGSLIIPSIIIGMNYFLTNHRLRFFNRRIFKLTIISLIAVVFAFGVIGHLRTAGSIEGGSIMQLFNYLEYPLINMEWQLREFGLLDGAENIIPLISGFIPYKLISGSDFGLDNTYAIYSFFYPEPGIGAGYFGAVHLAFGIVGVIVFGALTGLISRKVFNLAKFDPRWSVPYSCFVWPLISAHSYSHLTSILFFFLPFVLSIVISHFVFIRINRFPQNTVVPSSIHY